MNSIRFPAVSPYFSPIDISLLYNRNINALTPKDCSQELQQFKKSIPQGNNVLYGIPFNFGEDSDSKNNILLIKDKPVAFLAPKAITGFKYLVFAHSADFKRSIPAEDGIISPMTGEVRLGEVVALYRIFYDDETSFSIEVKRRFNINDFSYRWGESAFESVLHLNPRACRPNTDGFFHGKMPEIPWGDSQSRVKSNFEPNRYALWLYALENPHPDKKIVSMEFEPQNGSVLISGITGCMLDSNPLRWETRKKAVLSIPEGKGLNDSWDFDQIEIDLGQVISVQPQLNYENVSWETGYNNKQPKLSNNTIVIEYAAHPSARIYLGPNKEVAVLVSELQKVSSHADGFTFQQVPEATKHVVLKVRDQRTKSLIPAKIHVHGAAGEYLPPMNRHRIPNAYWFEDYSTDFVHGSHFCTYIDGEAEFRFPFGEIFLEVSKGFEIKPLRKRFVIDADTDEIQIELDKVLNWREKGWITADTHVHFLSPNTALLEGEAEGVNVVNLLASQWGELFTNIGDFDGKTTFGSAESGGKGEYLVRVGTENRQQILGHISLLGYEGRMILPLTTGGPDESAIGDSVEETLTNWAKRCRQQNGVVILPHFPNPRAEGAAAIISDMVDGVEMTSWDDLYSGINPYSLSDWYRYLNCGYHIPVVGGTDKMSADTAVGTVRTYAKIRNELFSYENWKNAIRKGCTFATYGPLLEFQVEGKEAGDCLELPHTGGTLQVEFIVETVTLPVTSIELVVNGKTSQICRVDPLQGTYAGSWTLKVEKSCWVALRVRGRHSGKDEIIAAHSSAVMVKTAGTQCFDPIDAITILDQIEGAAAYIKNIGTKAEERVYKEMLMSLTSAHMALHERMHKNGNYHNHTVVDAHHKLG